MFVMNRDLQNSKTMRVYCCVFPCNIFICSFLFDFVVVADWSTLSLYTTTTTTTTEVGLHVKSTCIDDDDDGDDDDEFVVT